jgi:hypothetical protein
VPWFGWFAWGNTRITIGLEKKMQTRITTKAARVALAQRESHNAEADIERRVAARAEALARDPRATGRDALERLCHGDPVCQKLAVELIVRQVLQNVQINGDWVPSIQDDGSIGWLLPEAAKPAS